MANNNSNDNSPPSEASTRNRRGSFTTQTFNSIFGRSTSASAGPTAPFPTPVSTAASADPRRRMSISTLGLSGTSPTQTTPFSFGGRRGSVSTAGSDSIDENAIDDEDGPAARSVPTTPFVRRMSFGAQALRTVRNTNGTSPGATGRSPSYTTAPKPNSLPTIPSGPSGGGVVTPPRTQAQQASTQSKPRTASDFPVPARTGESGGFNWSEQLRSRAESSVSQSQRPSFSSSTSSSKAMQSAMTDRNRGSISEMPAPPASSIPTPTPPKPVRKQPDAFQERILKGDFHMD